MPPIKEGSIIKLKGGAFEWEYRGKTEDGKLILYGPLYSGFTSGYSLVVKEEEVDWRSVREKK